MPCPKDLQRYGPGEGPCESPLLIMSSETAHYDQEVTWQLKPTSIESKSIFELNFQYKQSLGETRSADRGRGRGRHDNGVVGLRRKEGEGGET